MSPLAWWESGAPLGEPPEGGARELEPLAGLDPA